MSEIRVDLDTASRDELVTEVRRLNDVCQRWADGWQAICEGNTQGWLWQVQERDERIAMLEGIVNNQ